MDVNMKQRNSIWDNVQKELEKLDLDEKTKKILFENLLKLKVQKINILLAGATGCGKSSTINSLFDIEIAKVGYGVDPETMEIANYELDNLILWDSPGLGDSPENDSKHSQAIIKKLHEKDINGDALIDLVLVIIDGSSRDMGTSYELINKVIIPNMEQKDRILIAINQCDNAMKGEGWNFQMNSPNPELEQFLDDKVNSVKRRIIESTNVEIEPIYYSALHKYNISKLLSFIIKHTPSEKRAVYINNLNKNPEVWKSNDSGNDYNGEINSDFEISLLNGLKGAKDGAIVGYQIGKIIPVIGPVVGATVGAAIGFIGGLFSKK
ncbi:MAG TPA: GTPase [Patescibacteria group bacterium]|nr:GTPase [Patescibacteria group bacterium]